MREVVGSIFFGIGYAMPFALVALVAWILFRNRLMDWWYLLLAWIRSRRPGS